MRVHSTVSVAEGSARPYAASASSVGLKSALLLKYSVRAADECLRGGRIRRFSTCCVGCRICFVPVRVLRYVHRQRNCCLAPVWRALRCRCSLRASSLSAAGRLRTRKGCGNLGYRIYGFFALQLDIVFSGVGILRPTSTVQVSPASVATSMRLDGSSSP